jgi:hypothetical protein
LAIESTVVYWRPVYIILEDDFRVIPVNPRYIKNVAGRKTYLYVSRWIVGLLKDGLLRGSFIPLKRGLAAAISYTHAEALRSNKNFLHAAYYARLPQKRCSGRDTPCWKMGGGKKDLTGIYAFKYT